MMASALGCTAPAHRPPSALVIHASVNDGASAVATTANPSPTRPGTSNALRPKRSDSGPRNGASAAYVKAYEPGSHATRALLTPKLAPISAIIGLAITSPAPIRNIDSESATTGSRPARRSDSSPRGGSSSTRLGETPGSAVDAAGSRDASSVPLEGKSLTSRETRPLETGRQRASTGQADR